MSSYKTDLFISYAHIDNVPLSPGNSGWISRFHTALSAHLSMKLGKSVRIWRDDKLQGNDRFADEIVEQFDTTAVLVSVLTPRYLNSEWCTREVDEFCRRTQENLFVDNKARIFKIVKTPVDSESALPSIMQELLGYDFYVFEDGAPMALDEEYGQQYGQDFRRKVNNLAYQISELLKTLEASNDETAPQPLPQDSDKPVVYLADCAYDMKATRDAMQTRLNSLGYQVLPDRQLPVDAEDYSNAVTSMLTRSDISIHLVGQQYGSVPDGPDDESTSQIQNRLAAQMSLYSSLERLIWLGEQPSSSDEKQQRFIDELQYDDQAQRGADVLIGDVEKLKSELQSLLDRVEADLNPSSTSAENQITETIDDQSSVYLICTEQDADAIQPLREYLEERGLIVSIPEFKGDATMLRQSNQQLLTNSDKIMVFYGEGDAAWKKAIDTELRKLPAYLDNGSSTPPIYTYLAEPHSFDKDDLIENEIPDVLDGFDALNTSALDEIFALSSTVQTTT